MLSRVTNRPKGWARAGSIVALLILCVVGALFGFGLEAHAADVSFLAPHGPIAAAERQHFFHVILLMMIVILPVLIGVPLLAWRYRYRNTSARYAPNWDHSRWISAVIWGVPVAIVIVLATWLVQNTTKLDPFRPLETAQASLAEQPLKVDVIGYDWKWLFVYPQLHIASLGQLVFPEHRAVSMRLTSATVMQSFYIPALASQIYAMAAMETKLHLIATTTGQFLGENTLYDGMGFQHEKFVARATTPQGFHDWVAGVSANGIPLTAKVYGVIRARNTVAKIHATLKAKGMPPGALFFKDVQPALFRNVVMSFRGGPSTSRSIVGIGSLRAGTGGLTTSRREPHTTGMD
ncbi:MAG: hypothetical protein ACREFD_04545 [Stellaceae bacterium]